MVLPATETNIRESDAEVAFEKILERYEDVMSPVQLRANRGLWIWADEVAEWFDRQE
jgi:hypothetical protein